MIDFNTRKRLIKKFSDCAEKHAILLIPCLIAAVCVKLFYFVACNIDIALSDKNGNFLGIENRKKPAKAVKRKQDDIVYKKKPVFARLISAVLAFSFMAMFVPELNLSMVSFAASTTYTNTFIETAADGSTPAAARTFVAIDGDTSKYYVKAEYDPAAIKTVSNIKLTVANGKIKATWDATAGVTGYFVDCYVNGQHTVNNYDNKALVTYTISNLTITDSVMFTITPYTNVYYYTYSPTTIFADDGVTSIPVRLPVRKTQDKILGEPSDSDTVTPDTMLENPVINVDSVNIDEITLSWNNVTITNTSYSNPSYVVKYDIKQNEFGAASFTDKVLNTSSGTPFKVDRGKIYRYYILAHSTFFNGAEVYSGIFPQNNVSMSEYVAISPDVVTTDNSGKHFDRAKVTPGVDLNKSTNLLDISWRLKSGSCTGYEVYRYYPADLADVDAFNAACSDRDTLVANLKAAQIYQSPVLVTHDSSKEVTTWTDRDTRVVNGETYFYYVVPYLSVKAAIPTGSDLYGTPILIRGPVNISLTKPTNVKATPIDGEIDLTWTASTDTDGSAVDGYYLYVTKNKDYSDTKTTITTNNTQIIDCGKNTSYQFTTFQNAKIHNYDEFTFEVVAYKNIRSDGTSDVVLSDTSTPVTETVGIPLTQPKNLNGTTTDGSNTLTWDALNTAEYYEIWGRNVDGSSNAPFIYIGESNYKTATYTHSGTQRGKEVYNGDTWEYYVVGYKTVNGVKVISPDSEHTYVTVGVSLAKPTDITGTTADGKNTITWTKDSSVKKYILYASKGGITEKFEITSNKFEHSPLNNGDTWSYYVMACKEVNGKYVYSPKSDTISLTVGISLPAPKDFKVTSSETTATLTWSKVTGAEGYVIYATDGASSYKFDVTNSPYTHANLSNGQNWSYYIEAYKTVNGIRVYSPPTQILSVHIGTAVDTPKDFNVVTTDGNATISWTAVKNAEGYIIYASNGKSTLQFDVSKSPYIHSGLANGDTWSYYAVAYKTVNGSRMYSSPTATRTVQIGVSMSVPADLIATAGNKQIDLSWSKVAGAEGYVVYLYDSSTLNFEPLTITSGTKYSHTGLKNGKTYTYMVAAYKTINGSKFYGDYSLPVSAIPTTGSATDLDRELNVKGTTPYGISNSQLITAAANHEAFEESVDIYISVNDESTNAVKSVLKRYANGLSSFIIYPFDISCYLSGTKIHTSPAPGFAVTITMPVPDKLIKYRDYISVVHVNEGDDVDIYGDDPKLEIVKSAIIDIDGVWCIQFQCTSFSPFAFVIYKDQISDISNGIFANYTGSLAGNFNSGVLLMTAIPDIMLNNKKLSVVHKKKKYRVKKK